MASPSPSWSAEGVTVLVVDDQEPFRAAARFVVRATVGLDVVGEAALLLSTYSAEDLPAEARTCGARGYVHKSDLTPDVLLAVVDGTHPSGF